MPQLALTFFLKTHRITVFAVPSALNDTPSANVAVRFQFRLDARDPMLLFGTRHCFPKGLWNL